MTPEEESAPESAEGPRVRGTKAERNRTKSEEEPGPAPTPKKSDRRERTQASPPDEDEETDGEEDEEEEADRRPDDGTAGDEAAAEDEEEEGEEKEEPAKRPPARKRRAKEPPRAPRRPTLDPEARRLLAVRREQDERRPRFTRQASYRYYRIGRRDSWRRPRGQQSKQRRHYGFRSTIVSIGFRSPRAVRGMTPTGFVPRLVRTPSDIEALDVQREAAVVARAVGTRKRLALEEVARRKGLHVLNPLVREEREEAEEEEET